MPYDTVLPISLRPRARGRPGEMRRGDPTVQELVEASSFLCLVMMKSLVLPELPSAPSAIFCFFSVQITKHGSKPSKYSIESDAVVTQM